MESFKPESYVLYKGWQRMSVEQYEELQQKYKTAKCYYYHWRDKVIDLARIIYPENSQFCKWALSTLPVILHIGYDLIKEQVEYEYETQQLIKLYHKLKLEKWKIKP